MGSTHSCGHRDLRALSNVRIGHLKRSQEMQRSQAAAAADLESSSDLLAQQGLREAAAQLEPAHLRFSESGEDSVEICAPDQRAHRCGSIDEARVLWRSEYTLSRV